MSNVRIIYVLIGPPAVGKSTWIKNNMDENNVFILSNDNVVEYVAKQNGWTYDDLFKKPPPNSKIGDIDEKYGEIIPSDKDPKILYYKNVIEQFKKVNELFKSEINKAKNTHKNVVVDLVNMDVKLRKNILDRISNKEDYKIAVVFKFINKEKIIKNIAKKRSEKIGDKNIPNDVFDKIFKNYTPPTQEEKFDKIIYSNDISKMNLSETYKKRLQELSGINNLPAMESMIDKYKLRYPQNDMFIIVNINKLLQRHKNDEPSYAFSTKETSNYPSRVERAKEYWEKYSKDQRPISLKDGLRKNWDKMTFEAPYVTIENGKLGFADGRHRVVAMKELGYDNIIIEIPKKQFKEFQNL